MIETLTTSERIKLLRTRKGLSQEELAEKLGKDQSTVHFWENGRGERLPLETLRQIAEALQCALLDLIGRAA